MLISNFLYTFYSQKLCPERKNYVTYLIFIRLELQTYCSASMSTTLTIEQS